MEAGQGVEPVYTSVPLHEAPSNQYSVIEECDLSIRTKFLNYSGRTVYLGMRNGLVVPLPSRTSRSSTAIIVRQEVDFTNNLKDAVRDQIVNHNGIESRDLTNFKELFMQCYKSQLNGLVMKYDHQITPAVINGEGGTVYMVETDIILSTKRDNIPLHPFCFESMSRPNPSAREEDDNGLGITIIDNKGEIGPRFARVLGKVFKIEVSRNTLKRDGVYVAYRGIQERSHAQLTNLIEYTEPSEIHSLGWMYSSYAEANIAPEREAQLTHEIKEMDLAGKKVSAVTNMHKTEADFDRLDLERRNIQLQQQLDENERRNKSEQAERERLYSREDYESKIQQLRVKDHYEERAYVRKDSSEWLKALPTILVGAGAAVMAVRSLFSN